MDDRELPLIDQPPQTSAPAAASPPHWPLVEVGAGSRSTPSSGCTRSSPKRLSHSTVLTRFAVPFFVAACVFLVFQGVRRKPQRAFLEYARSRFVRIYLPFLAWSAVYLAFKAIKSVSLPEQPNQYPSGLHVLWAGGFYHLWFMPFILVVSLAAFALAKAVYGREWWRWPVAITLLAAGLAIGLPRIAGILSPNSDPPHHILDPLYYMLDALPAAFWGAALGLIYDGGQSALMARLFAILY